MVGIFPLPAFHEPMNPHKQSYRCLQVYPQVPLSYEVQNPKKCVDQHKKEPEIMLF